MGVTLTGVSLGLAAGIAGVLDEVGALPQPVNTTKTAEIAQRLTLEISNEFIKHNCE